MKALLCLLLGALLAGAAPARAEQRVALVVGNANYRTTSRLDNPTNDALLIANTLRELGFTIVGNGPQRDLDIAALRQAVQVGAILRRAVSP